MKTTFNDWELDQKYEKVEELRKQVQENTKALEYYEYLKELNKGDQLYGWMFPNILEDTPEDLDMYQKPYIRDILNVYIGELETILYKINL